MKNLITIGLILCTLQGYSQSQHRWTLEECIRHAVENNIDIKMMANRVESAEIDLNTSQNARLPNLSASANQNLGFGRSPSVDGTLVARNSANSSGFVTTQIPLFSGFRLANDIKAKEANLGVALENLEKAKDDLSLNIASLFLQALFSMEVEGVARLQIELTTKQLERVGVLYEQGRIAESQLYDIRAQLARDNVTLVDAQNNTRVALLNLSQLLELDYSEGFAIAEPLLEEVAFYAGMIALSSPDRVYERATQTRPAIKAQEFAVTASEYNLEVAKAFRYPTLTMSGQYSNGYYHYFNSAIPNASFIDQIRRNGTQTIGVSLSIPIFNRNQINNGIRSSRVALNNNQLALESVKKSLYNEIHQAYINATASLDKYNSSTTSAEASKVAFDYAEKRYSEGISTIFEFEQAKTNYMQSLASQLQAKYDLVFRCRILDFYNGARFF